uniref:Kinesin-like protein n=1 Tax=Albugo laibachii Nc14 TaxID=890382 RepID=F0WQM8_9STRA|nr:kinesinlike protein KIF6 putative [Albugo laibachii Nc14]|eukprot:CCA23637.1 kinesinlike protein KIF6 putative [Albugo laibachii Nc14]
MPSPYEFEKTQAGENDCASVSDTTESSSVALSQPESDSNIRIYLRIKPSRKPSGFFHWDEEVSAFKYEIPKDNASGLVDNSRTKFNFRFDSVIGVDAKQAEVFDRVGRPCVENALDGFNSTVFAYGQTGSGKTFTITGGAQRYEDRGLIPRTLAMIFETMKKQPERQFQTYISYLEIYNNQGYDLLDPGHETTKSLEDLPRVSMMEDEDGNCHLRNLSMHLVSAEEDALNLLFLGDTNRAVSETPMNLASSRSHCIFTVSLESRRAGATEIVLRSKLHLVDLAGSERAHKTGAKGQLLREATYINTSLHYLEMVIVALHEKSTKGRGHIPYRNSMMTSVLRDSLGGNCKTVMVATVSAEKEQTDESISTCRFAQRVARVRNDAHLNEELDPHIVIRQLKSQLASLQEELAILRGDAKEGDELKDYEREKLHARCEDFLNDTAPDARLCMGEFTYSKMRACFEILKDLAKGSTRSNDARDPAIRSRVKVDGNQELVGRLEELEQLVLQRDNEIAIMVNMIREQDPGAAARLLDEKRAMQTHGRGKCSKTFKKKSVEADNSFHPDTAILNDPAKAFEEFKAQYPNNDAIRDNKILLKKKYDQAKELASRVNDARNQIKSLTVSIEKLRKQQAIAQEGLVNADNTASSIPSLQIEESSLKDQVDTYKAEYKKGFNQLSDLKVEIQHLQKLLEMSRIKLQKDFDLWYQKQGKGLLLAEKIANDGVDAALKAEAKSQYRGNQQIDNNQENEHDFAKSRDSTLSIPRSITKSDTKKAASVDDDVNGFYEALAILKRRA